MFNKESWVAAEPKQFPIVFGYPYHLFFVAIEYWRLNTMQTFHNQYNWDQVLQVLWSLDTVHNQAACSIFAIGVRADTNSNLTFNAKYFQIIISSKVNYVWNVILALVNDAVGIKAQSFLRFELDAIITLIDQLSH